MLEKPLFGGLVDGRVVKVDDTVRKPAGPWTPTIHALLEHLQSKGFPCPRPLGLDEQGREILTYIRGRGAMHPWPQALLATSGARQVVGAMLRAYHTAVADFVPPAPPVWRHGPQALAPGEIVVHGDFGPHNLIWSSDGLAGVIDFELARPAPPKEETVIAAVLTAHLRPDELAKEIGFDSTLDRRARLAAFAEGYGTSPAALLDQALEIRTKLLQWTTGLARAGIEPWAEFDRRGLHARRVQELPWFKDNLSSFL